MDPRNYGLFLVAGGLLLALVGLLLHTGALGWFGRLPGDIRIDRGTTRIYFPLGSMLVASLALSVLLALLRRIL